MIATSRGTELYNAAAWRVHRGREGMIDDILRTYSSLRTQAMKALRAKRTRVAIAGHRRAVSPTQYLRLYSARWAIAPLPAGRRVPANSIGLIEIPLPYSDDPDPLRHLAETVDRHLHNWLRMVALGLAEREIEALRQRVGGIRTLEQKITGTAGKQQRWMPFAPFGHPNAASGFAISSAGHS